MRQTIPAEEITASWIYDLKSSAQLLLMPAYPSLRILDVRACNTPDGHPLYRANQFLLPKRKSISKMVPMLPMRKNTFSLGT